MQFEAHVIAIVICSTNPTFNFDLGHEHHSSNSHARMSANPLIRGTITDRFHTPHIPPTLWTFLFNFRMQELWNTASFCGYHIILFIYFCSSSGASSVRCPSMCHCDMVSDGAISTEPNDNNKRNNENEVIRKPQYRQTISSVRLGNLLPICTVHGGSAILYWKLCALRLKSVWLCESVCMGMRVSVCVCVCGKNGRQDKIDTSDSDAAHTGSWRAARAATNGEINAPITS